VIQGIMQIEEFRASVTRDQPPEGLPAPLAALWWDAKGDWVRAHGLVDELDLLHVKGDGHFYERRPQRDHMHMTCLRCAKVQEFESDLFDRVKGQVERDCHFHILVARFEIGGYCASCRK